MQSAICSLQNTDPYVVQMAKIASTRFYSTLTVRPKNSHRMNTFRWQFLSLARVFLGDWQSSAVVYRRLRREEKHWRRRALEKGLELNSFWCNRCEAESFFLLSLSLPDIMRDALCFNGERAQSPWTNMIWLQNEKLKLSSSPSHVLRGSCCNQCYSERMDEEALDDLPLFLTRHRVDKKSHNEKDSCFLHHSRSWAWHMTVKHGSCSKITANFVD